ncbi:hypothetical protein FACS18942_00580 [Planctomycetales bacterium]|nr:hypothetical protein FACS18942_00580 [Planctomycetales bacterium]
MPFICADELPNTEPETNWSAEWITAADVPADTPPANLWLTFRKNFVLPQVPENTAVKYSAKIACDSKYWLYVNGKQVVFEGQLKRGPTPQDTYFDKVDLSEHLTAGKNTVAVLMWYFGKDGFSHKSSGKPGFLFELTDGKGLNVLSGKDWKAAIYSAYEQKTKDPQPNYRLSESNIRFDARKDFPQEWFAAGFDDSQWKDAKTLGKAPCAPWNALYERPIPQWKNYGVKDYESISVSQSTGGAVVAVCKLPYNAQITPVLKVEAEEGLEIDIRTDNYQGGGEYNVRAEYVTKNGVQEYESLGWMNGHKVIYTIPAAGVRILSLQYRETGYDTEFTGSFECDDPFYNELWKKSARTLYVTMRDTYFDCPDRERAQWWGDAVNELGEAFYALDSKSALLPRKGFYELLRWQRKDGAIFSPVPAGNWDRELPMQMLATVGQFGIRHWVNTTGDEKPLKDLSPQIEKYLDLFQFGDDELVLHRKGAWDWGDWGDNIDLRVLTNCWYYLAAAMSEEKKKKFKENFNKVFWTGTEYRDPVYKKQTDDRANAMAVIAGLAKEENYPAIREVLLREKHASPYMEKYVLEALFKMGYADDALARMKERFKKMVEHPDYTTLWEGWGIGKEGFGGGTTNHAWSGGGLTMLSQYVAGVSYTDFSNLDSHYYWVSIVPQPGTLKTIKSKTPTAYGDIIVDINRGDSSFKMQVTLPPKVGTVFVSVPKKYLNGKKLKTNMPNVNFGEKNGEIGIMRTVIGAKTDGGVPAGTWTFETE